MSLAPLNRELNAFVILRQLFQLGQVAGPSHDASIWAGLVGDRCMGHDFEIIPDAPQLTPFSTGRDNRRSSIITGRYCCGCCALAAVPRPEGPGRSSRALVILRDGLTDYVFKVAVQVISMSPTTLFSVPITSQR